MSLELVPGVPMHTANLFIRHHHRHHRPVRGCLFSIGVRRVGEIELCGVAIVGRPVARMLVDGYTAEVTRVATDGERNACSILYAAARRAWQAMGGRRLVTYTLREEGGASLRASGWTCAGPAGGGSWSREGRERRDEHPMQEKIRWEARAIDARLAEPPKVAGDA